jgi:hypothetical protein
MTGRGKVAVLMEDLDRDSKGTQPYTNVPGGQIGFREFDRGIIRVPCNPMRMP